MSTLDGVGTTADIDSNTGLVGVIGITMVGWALGESTLLPVVDSAVGVCDLLLLYILGTDDGKAPTASSSKGTVGIGVGALDGLIDGPFDWTSGGAWPSLAVVVDNPPSTMVQTAPSN